MTSTVDLVLELADSAGLIVSFVNLGGGPSILYFPKERPLDLSAYSEPAPPAVQKLKKGLGDRKTMVRVDIGSLIAVLALGVLSWPARSGFCRILRAARFLRSRRNVSVNPS